KPVSQSAYCAPPFSLCLLASRYSLQAWVPTPRTLNCLFASAQLPFTAASAARERITTPSARCLLIIDLAPVPFLAQPSDLERRVVRHGGTSPHSIEWMKRKTRRDRRPR